MHEFLGLPTIPLIGRYNHNSYSIDQTKLLFVTDCSVNQNSNKYFSTTNN